MRQCITLTAALVSKVNRILMITRSSRAFLLHFIPGLDSEVYPNLVARSSIRESKAQVAQVLR